VVYREIKSKQDALVLQNDLKALDSWQHKWQMSFNVNKCFLLRITHKNKPLITNYTLGRSTLKQTSSHSYLGVEITGDLKWNSHISNVTAKANRSLGFIRRNLYSCPQNLKAKAYTSLVRPLLEYSSSVWDPHTGEQIKKLEAVQRRAARFVMHDYDYMSSPTEMMKTLKWDSLQTRRKVNRTTMMCKITNGQAAIPAQQYLHPVTRTTRGLHNKAYQRPAGNKDCWVNSFFPNTIRDWNNLPQPLVSITEPDKFKEAVRRHYEEQQNHI
jgi:hypothetical protein